MAPEPPDPHLVLADLPSLSDTVLRCAAIWAGGDTVGIALRDPGLNPAHSWALGLSAFVDRVLALLPVNERGYAELALVRPGNDLEWVHAGRRLIEAATVMLQNSTLREKIERDYPTG